MKVTTSVLGAFAALALAVPTELEQIKSLESRAQAGDDAALNELVDRQIHQCYSCIDGWRYCCGLICSRNKC